MEPVSTVDLRAAIDRLYAVFAEYPLRTVAGCPCCVTVEEERQLHARPLRELTAEDLRHFGYSALYTWGEVDDFKHFLPRLLELSALDPAWSVDVEILTRKLAVAEWEQWSAAEREAVEAYLMAWWKHTLHSESDAWDPAGECLCAIAQAQDDLGPYLDYWDRSSGMSLLHLAFFIGANTESRVNEGKLRNSFWRERSDPMQQVIAWLRRPELLDVLEQEFYREMEQPDAEYLSDAVEYLTILAGIETKP